ANSRTSSSDISRRTRSSAGWMTTYSELFDSLSPILAAILASLLLGDFRMPLRESFDVHFVYDRLVPGPPRRPIVAPVEVGIGDYGPWHEGCAIGAIEDEVSLGKVVRVDRLVPFRVTLDGARVRIEQQLGGIGAQALLRLPGAMDSIAVALAGIHADQVPVPDEPGALREIDEALVAVAVE